MLWIVATPIGNLGDLSDRAKETLSSVDEILCEDTRRTRTLLSVLGIQKKLTRFDAHATKGEISCVVRRLKEGENLALVSDAGTPGVSDPAADLVAEARKEGIPVSPIPGPSAVTALLSVSGMKAPSFEFRGFFPRKKGDQEKEWSAIQGRFSTVVYFESPQRIEATLTFLQEKNSEVVTIVAKELTKQFEKFFTGSLKEVLSQVQEEIEREGAKGEWCFALSLPQVESETSEEAWRAALQCLLQENVSPSRASHRVSQVFGISKNKVYQVALEFSGKNSP